MGEIAPYSASFDIETERFDPKNGKHLRNVRFKCGAVVYEDRKEYYTDVKEYVKRLNAYPKLNAHNAPFDHQCLKREGFQIDPKKLECTMLMGWLLDENNPVSLEALSQRYLGAGKTQSIADGFEIDVDDPKTKEYVIQDAALGGQLRGLFRRKMKDEGVEQLFDEIDMPFRLILDEATNEGVCVDLPQLEKKIKYYEDRVKAVKDHFMVVHGVNIASSKQVWKCLYYFPKSIPKQKDGTPKSDTKTIASVPKQYLKDTAQEILDWRKEHKLLGTFLKGLKKAIEPDGLAHPLYNMTRARTGRLSSGGSPKSYPHTYNIQNVANKNQEVRECIIAKPGTSIVLIDAEQLEYRVLAHYAEDETLIQAFLQNKDLHVLAASLAFEKPEAEITSKERADGKTINYASMYGTTASGLEWNMGIPLAKGEKLLKAFYEGLPGLLKLKEAVRQQIGTKGFIQSLYGRKRRVPEAVDLFARNPDIAKGYLLGKADKSNNARLFYQLFKEAFSGLIQGTAMDLMKECCINALKVLDPSYKFFLQVHDEFGFYVPKEKEEQAAKEIKEAFEQGHRPFSVPILFKAYIGKTWAIKGH